MVGCQLWHARQSDMLVTCFLPESKKAGRCGGPTSHFFAMVTCTSEYTSKKEGGISKSSSAAFASQKILNYPQMGIGALFIPLPENVIQAIKNATLQHLGEELRCGQVQKMVLSKDKKKTHPLKRVCIKNILGF